MVRRRQPIVASNWCNSISSIALQETLMAEADNAKQESRLFNPPASLVQGAAISGMAAYQALCQEAERDYDGFWGRLARETLDWHKPFTTVLDESNAPFY